MAYQKALDSYESTTDIAAPVRGLPREEIRSRIEDQKNLRSLAMNEGLYDQAQRHGIIEQGYERAISTRDSSQTPTHFKLRRGFKLRRLEDITKDKF